jgi:ABC-type transporter Mla maintaining outer membrane lipid asymmetry ATPase subunit MlaF
VTPVVELSGVSKDYRGLRPLRIRQLTVSPGDRVAILGLDQPSAEVLLNLITGATLPDSGVVTAFGRGTDSIADSSEWLAFVDRFGIVSERAVLLEAMTVVQNLAIPFTLDIEPLAEPFRQKAIALATEARLGAEFHDARVGDLDPGRRARLRVARALALNPQVLLVEHLSAGIPRADVPDLGEDIAEIATRRGIAVIAATADTEFARAIADRVLTIDPATGALADASSRGWFRRRLG